MTGFQLVLKGALEGILLRQDLDNVDQGLDALMKHLEDIEKRLDNLRDKSDPVSWDNITDKPLADTETEGLVRIDSVGDSWSETIGASIWIVKNLQAKVGDMVKETRKINGKTLDKDVVITPKDLGALTEAEFDKKAIMPDLSGYVLKTTKVNGQPLSKDVTIDVSSFNGVTIEEGKKLLDEIVGTVDSIITPEDSINGKKLKDYPLRDHNSFPQIGIKAYKLTDTHMPRDWMIKDGVFYSYETIRKKLYDVVPFPFGEKPTILIYEDSRLDDLVRVGDKLNGRTVPESGNLEFTWSDFEGGKSELEYFKTLDGPNRVSRLVWSELQTVKWEGQIRLPRNTFAREYDPKTKEVLFGKLSMVMTDGTEVPINYED